MRSLRAQKNGEFVTKLLNQESGAYAFTADPDEGVVIVGRENDCNFIVKEDGVSRHHCKIWFDEGQWHVEDSQSRHGTLVNNKQIRKPAILKNGDVLKLAGVNFMVSLHATNDPKDIGKALAGGARDKLKMLNAPPKGPPARPTRVMRAPPKSRPYSANVADDEPVEPEAPPLEEPPVEETASKAPDEPTDTEASAEDEGDAEQVAVASKEKPTASKLRPGLKGSPTKDSATKSRTGKVVKAPKEAPKKGGGMLKIIAAVVIFAGAGAAAYFALLSSNDPEKGTEKGTPTEAKKDEPKKEEAKKEEAAPSIPAKPEEAKEAPKDPAAAPKTDEKPASPAP